MEAVGRDGIGGKKRPMGEDRLDDLKTMGDPVNAAEQSLFVHAGGRRSRQSKHNLRLETRFGQAAQRNVHAPLRQVMDRAVVDISPHRRMNVVFGPDSPVCETDLASDRSLSTRLSQRPNRSSDPISVRQWEIRATGGERRNLAASPQDGEGLVCDVLNIHLAGLPTVGASWLFRLLATPSTLGLAGSARIGS